MIKNDKIIDQFIIETLNSKGIYVNKNNFNSKLIDIGIDSMEYIKLVIDCEERFSIEIPYEDLVIETLKILSESIKKMVEENE